MRHLPESKLREFEKEFQFVFHPDLRFFLLLYNGGSTSAVIPTVEKRGERTIQHNRIFSRLFDFSTKVGVRSAWALNQRLRPILGDHLVVIGEDMNHNYICVSNREYKQTVCILSHVSGKLEESVMDIPMLIRALN